MILEAKQSRLVEELGLLPDPQERFSYIMELSQQSAPLSPTERQPEHLVEGCQARVWLLAEEHEGNLRYRSDSDAPMVRAIAWLLSDFYSGASPREVQDTEPRFLEELALLRALTENRKRGTGFIIARIKMLARAHGA